MLRALMCIWYYIRSEMTPASVGGEQQISIIPGAGMFLAENHYGKGERIMGVTIQQIAEKAGVSRGTVDRALNNRGRINPEVAEMVKKTAEEMGYVHKARKRQKNTEGKKKIGIVTQLAGSSFMLEVKRGIFAGKRELEELGIEVLVKENTSVREEDQLRAIDELVKEGIQGLALMPVDSERVREKLNWLVNEKKIPVVTFNSDIVGTKRCCFVGMNNKLSGQTAAGLFGMMTRGTGKILIITGYFSSMLNNSRVDGFVEEIKQISPKLEIAGVQGSFNNADEVERIIENAMMNISGINGIFVVSGGQEGIAKALKKLGVEQRPYVVIYDQTTKNETLLKENVADFLIDQNGFEQGYRPQRILVDILLNGKYPEKEYLYTGIDIKTKYNL